MERQHKSLTFLEPCLEAKNETINIDPAELSDARWMSEERNDRNRGFMKDEPCSFDGFEGLTADSSYFWKVLSLPSGRFHSGLGMCPDG